jgi:hypothetical protein
VAGLGVRLLMNVIQALPAVDIGLSNWAIFRQPGFSQYDGINLGLGRHSDGRVLFRIAQMLNIPERDAYHPGSV